MVCILLSPKEYEERLAKLQAEYNAEQKSKAKLQEDIAYLQSSYEFKLSNLEKAHASRGSCAQSDKSILPLFPSSTIFVLVWLSVGQKRGIIWRKSVGWFPTKSSLT